MKGYLPTLILIIVCSTVVRAQIVDFSFVDFKKADSIAELYPLHSLKDLKILSDKLTRPLTSDLEKFRAIFKWVCINIDNDFELYMENKKKREKLEGDELKSWEKKFSARAFTILVQGHRTVCTGYAYLVKELAFHAGLTCKIVDGYGRNVQANIGGLGTANHSWNAVRLSGRFCGVVCCPLYPAQFLYRQSERTRSQDQFWPRPAAWQSHDIGFADRRLIAARRT